MTNAFPLPLSIRPSNTARVYISTCCFVTGSPELRLLQIKAPAKRHDTLLEECRWSICFMIGCDITTNIRDTSHENTRIAKYLWTRYKVRCLRKLVCWLLRMKSHMMARTPPECGLSNTGFPPLWSVKAYDQSCSQGMAWIRRLHIWIPVFLVFKRRLTTGTNNTYPGSHVTEAKMSFPWDFRHWLH